MQQKILIIEDEPAIADTIIYALKTEGFEPVWCTTGKEGKSCIESNHIQLIILDIGLPDTNGFDLCKEIRKSTNIPVIFLTARTDEIDRVVGLEIGGDDYVVKPFSPRELTARIKAVLRRSSQSPHPRDNTAKQQKESPFHIDSDRMCISYFGVQLELSRYEYKILLALLKHPGRVFSREQLMNSAWDVPDVSLERTVDTHIKTIRNKLRSIKPDLDPIETRRGFGYCIRAEQ